MIRLFLLLSNIHCNDCEETIYSELSRIFNLTVASTNPQKDMEKKGNDVIFFSLEGNQINLYENNSNKCSILIDNIKKVKKYINQSGFKLLTWELYRDGILERASNNTVHNSNVNIEVSEGFLENFNFYSKHKEKQLIKSHLKHCKKCQNEKESSKKVSNSDTESSFETVVENADKEFRAVFSIGGMTCASCSQAVSDQLEKILGNADLKEGYESNFSVNLLQHTAVVVIKNKQLINTISDSINDIGFECRLIEVLPVQRSINLKVIAVLGGITCAACANAIQSSVHELTFILDCGINVVTKTGQFIMEESTQNKNNIEILKNTIEDCGFEFQLTSTEKINFTSGKKKSRSISLNIEGMFCNHCPELVMEYLSSYGEAIVIQDPITLNHPFIKFTYIPDQNLNIRKILFDLNHIHSTEQGYKISAQDKGAFQCELVKPVSMDEFLRKQTKKEFISVLIRLAVATIFAIPTFIFGIVGMSLLPKSNAFRIWMEEPIWAGGVTRNTWILLILSTPVYLFSADIFHRKALKEIKSLWSHSNSFQMRLFKFGSMSLLVSLGTSVSYFASLALLILSAINTTSQDKGFTTTYFDSVVFLTFFLLIGKSLESFSKNKTTDSISELSSFRSSKATLVSLDGTNFETDQLVEKEYLDFGDYICISPGESPPIDCVIVDGSSEFDESALTGESTPVKHSPGHHVFSGTVNVGNGSIVAKIVSLEGESLIDQIINTVRDGQLRKAPIERTADVLTGHFVPIIILIAIVTWIIWVALAYSGSLPSNYLDIDIGGWAVWSLEFSIAVFVIACPCGIGLAAPTALFVGSGLAAKHGILARGGGVAFQEGANTKVICFDKTGTLTYGKLHVTNYAFSNQEFDSDEKRNISKLFAIQIARDMELSSKHPIAAAIKLFANEFKFKDNKTKLSQNKVPHIQNIPGKGLKGQIILDSQEKDANVWNKFEPSQAILGNESLFIDHDVVLTSSEKQLLHKWKSECKSIIIVGIKCSKLFMDDAFHVVLLLACRDQIRSETKDIIEYLQKRQKIECWMITGDNKLTAEAIGSEIGIHNVISEVLPNEKQQHIKKIQMTTNKTVAMVGDGINDAPALAAANVGIALSSGADLAVTSSDFILLNTTHPLKTLVTLFELSRTVFRRVKFNFAWSLIYNLIGIPIAAGVIYPYNNSRISPVWASAAMAASSVSVVMSSLALKFFKSSIKTHYETFHQNDQNEVLEDFIP